MGHEDAPPMSPSSSEEPGLARLKDGREVTLRSICPDDEPLMVSFHQTLSNHTVYMRYFCSLPLRTRVAHERLVSVCFVDHDRQIALVADHRDPASGEHRILGVGRLMKLRGKNEAEVAILVSDESQNQGLGSELLARILQIARDKKLSRVSAEMLRDNLAIQKMLQKAGFRVLPIADSNSVQAAIDLDRG